MSCPGNAAKTHRELFSEFYRNLLKEPLEDVLAICPRPLASLQLFQRMMHDIMAGGQTTDPIDQVRMLPSPGITTQFHCFHCFLPVGGRGHLSKGSSLCIVGE